MWAVELFPVNKAGEGAGEKGKKSDNIDASRKKTIGRHTTVVIKKICLICSPIARTNTYLLYPWHMCTASIEHHVKAHLNSTDT